MIFEAGMNGKIHRVCDHAARDPPWGHAEMNGTMPGAWDMLPSKGSKHTN
jgi:hypothetical protein